jgi:triosephosphate isomerase
MEKIILGNWKMNPQEKEEAVGLAKEIVEEVDKGIIGIAPPLVFLSDVSDVVSDSSVMLGAQDVFWEDKGSHTGEVSIDELKSLGVEFVIIGHSERRGLGESDKEVNKKVKQVLENDLKAVLCVGEPENMRNKGVDVAKRFVSGELEKGLEGVSMNDDSLIIAYEPIWAISTQSEGPASVDDVLEMISFIKRYLKINDLDGGTPVLYGGSINRDNAGEFLRTKEIDGVLVGRASLEADEFLKIIKSA